MVQSNENKVGKKKSRSRREQNYHKSHSPTLAMKDVVNSKSTQTGSKILEYAQISTFDKKGGKISKEPEVLKTSKNQKGADLKAKSW